MKFTWKGKEYSIDGYLASQLDSLVYNLPKDWDVVLIVTGNRMVRVGKSVIAQIICAYLAWALEKRKVNTDAYTINDIYFDNTEMMDAAFKKPKYSINHYDEGREGLAASKALKGFQQDLIDFFTECGQMNHIFVIVAPDFFELKEDIAVGRSECLINVYRKGVTKLMDIYKEDKKRPITVFQRGFFQFFSRERKAQLYDRFRSSKKKNYGLVKANFIGSFSNQYTVDEEEYKRKKADSLARFKQRKEKEKQSSQEVKVYRKYKGKLDLLYELIKDKGKTKLVALAKEHSLAETSLYEWVLKTKKQEDMEKLQREEEFSSEKPKNVKEELEKLNGGVV